MRVIRFRQVTYEGSVEADGLASGVDMKICHEIQIGMYERVQATT